MNRIEVTSSTAQASSALVMAVTSTNRRPVMPGAPMIN